jgi:hypothetical protein
VAAQSSTDLSLVVLGLLAWAAAALFAVLPPLAAQPAAAGAACGFGIGGGLCFLGAALASRRNGNRTGT